MTAAKDGPPKVLWPYAIVLGGTSIPLADVLADLTMHHGREDISDAPTATTLQITLDPVGKAAVDAFDVGQTLALTVKDGAAAAVPRFTGFVTDGSLDVDRLTIIGAALVGRLGLYPIGAADYPAEAWSARVTRAFTDAGLAARLELHPDPKFDPVLAARTAETAGPTTLGDYLAFLAPMVGALVSDRMNGNVFVQAVGARSLDAATVLDPADVEYAPPWVRELPRGNIVTVTYQGDQGASVSSTDSASVTKYGPRAETIDTAFENAADATARANSRLARAAYSHWNMTSAPIVRGLALEIGAPVVLADMPATAPYDPWTPLVEGWTDSITGADWSMTLALSDPLLSGLAIPWQDVPTADKWNTIDPVTAWAAALTLDDLEPG